VFRCPNCGLKTSGDYCQYCNYPILRGRRTRRRKVRKQAEKEAELAAKEKAKREAEEARKAEEAQKQAEKEAEPVLPSPIDFDPRKQIEESLKQVESIREELRAGKVSTKEAIQRLLDISERIPD